MASFSRTDYPINHRYRAILPSSAPLVDAPQNLHPLSRTAANLPCRDRPSQNGNAPDVAVSIAGCDQATFVIATHHQPQ
jgi:hypothetical protein